MIDKIKNILGIGKKGDTSTKEVEVPASKVGPKTYVIIGASAAAVDAIKTLRKLDKSVNIIVISKDEIKDGEIDPSKQNNITNQNVTNNRSVNVVNNNINNPNNNISNNQNNIYNRNINQSNYQNGQVINNSSNNNMNQNIGYNQMNYNTNKQVINPYIGVNTQNNKAE